VRYASTQESTFSFFFFPLCKHDIIASAKKTWNRVSRSQTDVCYQQGLMRVAYTSTASYSVRKSRRRRKREEHIISNPHISSSSSSSAMGVYLTWPFSAVSFEG
jgi:hypothetical protein